MTSTGNYKFDGRRLKEIRTHLGIKQKDFAKKLQISAAFLSEIEMGKKYPRVEVFNSLVEVFGINTNYLFTGEGRYFFVPGEEVNTGPPPGYSGKPQGEDVKQMKRLWWYVENLSFVRFAVISLIQSFLFDNRKIIDGEIERSGLEEPPEK